MKLNATRLATMRLATTRLAACALLAALAPVAAGAQPLRIEMKAAIDSADPHLLFTPNRNVEMNVYEALVFQDRFLRPQPGLAVSWRHLDPLTWEFQLRPGVRFHDGSALSAADVVFSFERARAAVGPRTYRPYLTDIASMTAPDAGTVRVVTAGPAPLLPNDLSTLFIVSAKAAAGLKTADFNAGRGTIGTGPYRWVRWQPGQQVVLERNEDYWGGRPAWSRVTIRSVTNDAARAADLLAGDADVIDAVPGSLLPRLGAEPDVRVVSDTSIFFLYLALDQFRDNSPFVAGPDGAPMSRNPLKDVRVRQAISLAINRNALVDRIMNDGATPAGQISPPGAVGHDPSLSPVMADPARARRLLTEAGWPNGFQLTLHCLNDRYAGDSQTCQAIGSMLTTVGIRARIEALPTSIFFRRAGAKQGSEFSAAMSIYGSSGGDPLQTLLTIVATNDPARNQGVNNRGRFSDPEVDRLIAAAQTTFDDAEREQLVQAATRRAIEQCGVIPIYFLKAEWAMQHSFTLEPRADGYTLATLIHPAP